MTHRELTSAVARATGEDLSTIEQRGFSIVDPDEVDFDPDFEDLLPQFLDWDEYALEHNLALLAQRQPSRAA